VCADPDTNPLLPLVHVASKWRVTIASFRGMGRGLVATQDLAPGTLVFQDPQALVFLKDDILGARSLFRVLPAARHLQCGPMVDAVRAATTPLGIPDAMRIGTYPVLQHLISRTAVRLHASALDYAVVPAVGAVPEDEATTVARVHEMTRVLTSARSCLRPEVRPDAVRVVRTLIDLPAETFVDADRQWLLDTCLVPYAIMSHNSWDHGLENYGSGGGSDTVGFLSVVAALANHSCTGSNLLVHCRGPLLDEHDDPFHRMAACLGTILEPVPRGAQLLVTYTAECKLAKWGFECGCGHGREGRRPRLRRPKLATPALVEALEYQEGEACFLIGDVGTWLGPMREAAVQRDAVLDTSAKSLQDCMDAAMHKLMLLCE
jgi:hypothetical protein